MDFVQNQTKELTKCITCSNISTSSLSNNDFLCCNNCLKCHIGHTFGYKAIINALCTCCSNPMCKNVKQFEKYAQQTKDLYVRQFDDWKKQNMIPLINNRNDMFDLSTRDVKTSTANDILFSRLVADTSYVPTVFSTNMDTTLTQPVVVDQKTSQFEVIHPKTNNMPLYNLFNDNSISPFNKPNEPAPPVKQEVVEEPVFETKSEVNMISTYINNYTYSLFDSYYMVLTNKNFVINPMSILVTLFIILRGAQGITETELKSMLFSTEESIDKNAIHNQLLQLISKLTSSYFIGTNMLVINDIIPIRKPFHKIITSLGQLVMFNNKTVYTDVNNINMIVEKKTNGTIQSILDTLIMNMKCVLINAHYFYMPLRYGFSKFLTKNEIFNISHYNKRSVVMLKMLNSSQYYTSDADTQLLEMEYSDTNYRFGICISNKFSIVTQTTLFQFISKLQKTNIDMISIPKFSQKNKFYIDQLYKNVLTGTTLFSRADVGYMTPSTSFAIDKYIHQTSFIFDGEGGMNLRFGGYAKSNITFTANVPFVYYVRYVPDNVLLLIGHYS